MREMIEVIAKALVDLPEQVRVSETRGEMTSLVELRVARSDVGKVIGEQGRYADAMRMLLNAASMKLRKKAVLTIIE